MTQNLSSNTQTPRVDDRPVWDVVFAVYGYPALLLAHRLKIFALLADNPSTLTEICNAVKINQRPAEAVLTVATALGCLTLQAGPDAPTTVAEASLAERTPNHFG